MSESEEHNLLRRKRAFVDKEVDGDRVIRSPLPHTVPSKTQSIFRIILASKAH